MNNIILIKITRAFIQFLTIYFVLKYCTMGKIPYPEIIMICSTVILTQTLLDIYQPIIKLN
jgi:hypothetical protein